MEGGGWRVEGGGWRVEGGISSPLMLIFHHLETPQAIKLKLSDFKDTF